MILINLILMYVILTIGQAQKVTMLLQGNLFLRDILPLIQTQIACVILTSPALQVGLLTAIYSS